MLPRRKSLKLLLTCLIVLVACSIIILEYIQLTSNPSAIIDYKSGKDKNTESDLNKSNNKVSEILNSVNEKLTDYYNNNFNTDNNNNKNKDNNFKNYKIPENLNDILNIINKIPDQVDLEDQIFIKNRKKLVDDNIKQLHNIINEKISEPKVDNLIRQKEKSNTKQELEQIDKNSGIDVDLIENDFKDRANAAIVALVRNQELKQLIETITLFEEKFNKKFKYPYVFLNNRKFSEKFKEEITKICSGDVYFEYIQPEIWDQPENIDKSEQSLKMYELKQKGIQYASLVSYHNMCRFYSGAFFNHPRMKQFKWYWRIEPGTEFYCDIDYDVFRFMEDNNKTYGFTINIYDSEDTIESLWTNTLEFVKQNPKYLHPNGSYNWVKESKQNPQKTIATKGYSTCHFWSNFEIANMEFFRSEAYTEYFNMLEKAGGFYYERWGDAPVHSLALALFEDKNNLHWFRDIGYKHHPYVNCPNSDKCGDSCQKGYFTYEHLYDQNCMVNWLNLDMSPDYLKQY
ncbi:unnamed protein product [[Candida] boidinii]|uniref:Unnamed protein product n=1 Tax=Candida boidinii TaxID=5477 RepID=A0ACB5TTX4_CANBO|nr:unnamed protein product [[Candida] boidinii]